MPSAQVVDSILVVVFLGGGIWFFRRFVLQCRKTIMQLSVAPTVVIVAIEEESDEPYTSLGEQQAIEGFIALLERENFRRLNTVQVTNTWLNTTANSLTPLYVSQDQLTAAFFGRAQGIFPATLTFVTGYADGASLTTSTPYGLRQDVEFLYMQFAFDAETALKAHLNRSQELEKQHGHNLPITSVGVYEQSRQAAMRHFQPSWNQRLIDQLVFNQQMYSITIVILMGVAGVLVLRSASGNSIIMAVALIVVFFVTLNITNLLSNRGLRLHDALDAGNVPAPDIRYPPVFEWNKPKTQKVKEVSL